MRRLSFLVALLAAAWLAVAVAPVAAAADASAEEPADVALRQLNALRNAAGMEGFGVDSRLAAAALGHARYLLAQPGAGHEQRRGGTGFTGVEPLDRARQARYPALLVSENIAQGNVAADAALDGLMAAIYHRFGFLDFDVNSVGIGYAAYRRRPESAGYVFLMSNSDVADLCKGRDFEGSGRYVYSVCVPDIRIEKSRYDAARERFGARQPEIVVWPPEDGRDIPPAFFDEIPDPLPDRDVSGYPISLSINPYRVKRARVLDFELVDLDRGEAVSPIRRLDADSDPHAKLGVHQFAWFPLQRLRWGARYQVRLRLELDGEPRVRRWEFTVRDVPAPSYTLKPGRSVQAFFTDAEGWVTVYVPPVPRGVQRLSTLEYRYPPDASVQSEFLDGNTLRIRVTGTPGSKVRFESDGDVRFDVVVAGPR